MTKNTVEKTEVDVHTIIPVKLRDEFNATGLRYSIWIQKAMEDEIYLQNELRKLKRNAVHQMGSYEEVSDTPVQPHPVPIKSQTEEQ